MAWLALAADLLPILGQYLPILACWLERHWLLEQNRHIFLQNKMTLHIQWSYSWHAYPRQTNNIEAETLILYSVDLCLYIEFPAPHIYIWSRELYYKPLYTSIVHCYIMTCRIWPSHKTITTQWLWLYFGNTTYEVEMRENISFVAFLSEWHFWIFFYLKQ